MTNIDNNKFENKSAKEMLAEIARLAAMLIWKITKSLLRVIIKFLKWLLQKSEDAIFKLIDWWHDNDTQAKLRIIRIKLKIAGKNLIRWTIIAFNSLCKFSVWAAKKLVQAIIHLKPTIKRIWQSIKTGAKKALAWSKLQWKKCKLFIAKRKAAYSRFRKTPGFKGLLIDIGNLLKAQIDRYMEEEQYESDAESKDEVELITEINEEDSKAQVIGKRLFSKVKDLVDVDEKKMD